MHPLHPYAATSVEQQEERILEALNAVLQSETFRRAKRLRELLGYLVSETLAGRGNRLKQFNIAVEAFGRDGDFYPQVEATVRTEAWRLRARLERYYQTEGMADRVRFSLPRGGFMPIFRFCTDGTATAAAQPPTLRSERRPRLLILPLSGLNIEDPDTVTAFHDEISSYLANLPVVAIVSRVAGEKPGQTPADLPIASRATQPAYLMEGSLFRQDQTYRLNLRIVDPTRNETVWSSRHEQQVQDMIAFQRMVATDVASSVQSWSSSRPITVVEEEFPPRSVLRDNLLLREYLRTAIQDRTASEQVALGVGRLTSGRAREAMAMFGQAIVASPGDGLSHTAMGLGHLQSGRLEDAFRSAARGVELAPQSAFAHSSLAVICMHMRDFDGAVMFAQKAVALAPEFDALKLLLGDCFLYAGFNKTAIAQLEEACRLMDEQPAALAHLGYAYARTGHQAKARDLLHLLQEDHVSAEGPNWAAMTLIHAGLEEVEQAFQWLDRAVGSRAHIQELLVLTSPAYDVLRAHSHFNSLALRLNAS